MARVFIIPRFKLNESNDQQQIGLIRRNITQSGERNPETIAQGDGRLTAAEIMASDRAKELTYSNQHNAYTSGIYTMAGQILKEKLQGIKFALNYKLASDGELPAGPAGMAEGENDRLNPEDIYDIEIISVEPDAAYVVFDVDKEIQANKMNVNPDGQKVIREDLFNIIISSDAFRQAMNNSEYMKVIKK